MGCPLHGSLQIDSHVSVGVAFALHCVLYPRRLFFYLLFVWGSNPGSSIVKAKTLYAPFVDCKSPFCISIQGISRG